MSTNDPHSNSLTIEWQPDTLQDLEDLASYIANDNRVAARKVVLSILQQIEQLRVFPELGRPGRVLGTRELCIPGTPFIVPYRVREVVIQILRVQHHAREWPSVL